MYRQLNIIIINIKVLLLLNKLLGNYEDELWKQATSEEFTGQSLPIENQNQNQTQTDIPQAKPQSQEIETSTKPSEDKQTYEPQYDQSYSNNYNSNNYNRNKKNPYYKHGSNGYYSNKNMPHSYGTDINDYDQLYLNKAPENQKPVENAGYMGNAVNTNFTGKIIRKVSKDGDKTVFTQPVCILFTII